MKFPLHTIRALLLLLLLATALAPQPAAAAHLKGGYIEYEYIGPSVSITNGSRYRITVYQYLDCNSTGGQVDDQIFLAVYPENSNIPYAREVVAINGTNVLAKGNFTCINNPPAVCYRIDRYVAEIDLAYSNRPYTVTVQRCCRIAGIANVSNSSGTGVTYSIQINTQDAAGSFLKNSSPVFAQKDTALVCAANSFQFPFEAKDPDGDSLVYSFTHGLNTPSREAKPNPPIAPPFTAVPYAPGYSANEPMGRQVTINPTTGVISGIAPPGGGEYVVAVLVQEYRNGIKIAESRKELHISVGNCDIPEASLPPRIINCNSFEVRFQNQSTSSGIFSYSWDFGISGRTNDTSNQPTPSFTYSDTGIYQVKLVTNRGGFCPDSAITEVRVFPGFNPDFNIDGVCQQLPYQFTDITTAAYGAPAKWQWDFGDPQRTDDRSSQRTASYSYGTPGNYTITFSVETSKGCADTLTKNLEVLQKPRVQLAFRDTLICSIDSLMLRASGPGTFSWQPAASMIGANTATPTVFPKDTTAYYVTMNDRGCTAADTVTVNVLDFIAVELGPDTTLCRTDAITLRPRTEALSFQWQPAALFSDPAARNPVITPTDSLTMLYLTANLGKCQARDSIRIRTVSYPVANAGPDTTICFNDAAMLRGSGRGSTAAWAPASGLSNTRAFLTMARPVQTTTYTLTVTDTLGCPKPVTDNVVVTVRPRIIINAGNDTAVVLNQPLQLNVSTNAPQVRWSPATALSNAGAPSPVALFRAGTLPPGTDTIRYTITATTPEGCSATDNLLVKVFTTAPSIFVPSGFTPNADGLNDILRPTLAGMRELSWFRIFNRYGQLVFETRQMGKGWDGRIKGLLQGSGAYVYMCQAVDFEGNVVSAKGSFVLVR